MWNILKIFLWALRYMLHSFSTEFIVPSPNKSIIITTKNIKVIKLFSCVSSKFHVRDLSLPLYLCVRCYCIFCLFWCLIFLRHWHLLEFSSSRNLIYQFYTSHVKCKQSIMSAIKVGSHTIKFVIRKFD